MALPYTRGEARDWARERMRGVANTMIASYTSDLSDINERGIRHDVRLEIEQGFMGFLATAETALSPDEYVRFVSTAVDEAAGKAMVIYHASFDTLEQNIAMARRCADAGAELALLSYPPNFYPGSEADIEGYTRAFCDTVDMAVMLFPVPLWGFERIHPASLSIELMERLVDSCPTVVAVKAEGGHPAIGGFVEAWERLNDRVVVSEPIESVAMALAQLVPLQFSGTSNQEYYGAAVPKMFDLIRNDQHAEAMSIYWQIHPARKANAKLTTIGGMNTVHRMAWKYQAWLSGYNGGPLRMPTGRLLYDQMTMLRGALQSTGLPVTEDSDDTFFVGRNPA
ncbi:dihydrodipicolinate synthase family protein [Mycobacterium sp. CVI_P3]|uniref:Dihydrodipicolinate synthase family protein n=1 Tax=Mycobacterium pinniadriaticum TaxID=2994102 RepID=A0ABT3SKY2_9MYCO|nr:dihydrodipicolinate synthase family protein [Mycobacterium pinniadriaticum]MCX2933753.1 dihydrodipicolinate synthase family protein [Mycobacterium pinniadriaticum]MCX2940175.1 dihydrodipicolinate synthase family protein [Mycobacterium pinniadriaticum]